MGSVGGIALVGILWYILRSIKRIHSGSSTLEKDRKDYTGSSDAVAPIAPIPRPGQVPRNALLSPAPSNFTGSSGGGSISPLLRAEPVTPTGQWVADQNSYLTLPYSSESVTMSVTPTAPLSYGYLDATTLADNDSVSMSDATLVNPQTTREIHADRVRKRMMGADPIPEV